MWIFDVGGKEYFWEKLQVQVVGRSTTLLMLYKTATLTFSVEIEVYIATSNEKSYFK